MSKWIVHVPVIHHRVAGIPKLTFSSSNDDAVDDPPTALSAGRGVLIAVMLSLALWVALLAVILR